MSQFIEQFSNTVMIQTAITLFILISSTVFSDYTSRLCPCLEGYPTCEVTVEFKHTLPTIVSIAWIEDEVVVSKCTDHKGCVEFFGNKTTTTLTPQGNGRFIANLTINEPDNYTAWQLTLKYLGRSVVIHPSPLYTCHKEILETHNNTDFSLMPSQDLNTTYSWKNSTFTEFTFDKPEEFPSKLIIIPVCVSVFFIVAAIGLYNLRGSEYFKKKMKQFLRYKPFNGYHGERCWLSFPHFIAS
ncbi:hypothetical protein Btru_009432 [Bulinus truncatus]|nr:hypothetical protein Btru_009432 [Bulinus truncatus]